MKPLSLQQASAWAGGVLAQGSAGRHFNRVSTDSRDIRPGDLFVALRGDKFDGHGFVAESAEKGAIAAMVDGGFNGPVPDSMGIIRVGDTLKGLQQLAAAYRRSLPVRIAAITGSNGKTSTKEMLASILSQKWPTHKTTGNLNNHIGVPLTLLSLEESHEWAVVEMGMNHPGEIRPLAEMAAPEIGIVTQAGWGHIEAFPDREAIAMEKCDLLRALPSTGKAFIQADNDRLRVAVEGVSAFLILAGRAPDAQYRCFPVSAEPGSMGFRVEAEGWSGDFSLPVMGWHMVENATLAVAVARELGFEVDQIAAGLAACSLPKNRLSITAYRSGWIMDDTYNASPDSMSAAFRTLKLLPGNGRLVALLGSMGELGSHAPMLHEETGREAAREGFGMVFSLGPNGGEIARGARDASSSCTASSFSDHKSLVEAYRQASSEGDRILVKGSRSQKMETVVAMLKETS